MTKTEFKTATISIDPNPSMEEFRGKRELIEYLRENGPTHSALMDFCSDYQEQYKSELCRPYPISDGKHLGVFLVPVREGILSLPYDYVDKTDYELFCLEDIRMLGVAAMDELIAGWNSFSESLRAAMNSMREVLAKKKQIPWRLKNMDIKRDTTADLFNENIERYTPSYELSKKDGKSESVSASGGTIS